MSAVPTSDVQQARERLERLRSEVARIYIGSSKSIDMMLVALVRHVAVLDRGASSSARDRECRDSLPRDNRRG